MALREMKSSGSDCGFFQQSPTLKNQAHDDVSFRRCLQLFLPTDVVAQTQAEIAALGDEVLSDQVFAWVTDAERNTPYLKGNGRDAFGRWNGELVCGDGWRQLQRFGLSKGIVAFGYDTPYGPFSRPLQFLRLHLWEGSCANVTCPSAMQDGAARLLQLHLAASSAVEPKLSSAQRRQFQHAFKCLTSRDPDRAWTSGQWMTERTGGSDVSLTETTAVYEPACAGDECTGPWRINGFKWFSSATDSNMTILLARTSAGGLSAFFAPLRKPDPQATTATGLPAPNGKVLNGVRIQRLKNKLGTKPLPTAELVLEDMRGWLVGREGRGIHEISAVLTLTRVHSAVAAVGYAGRGLGIARAYARVRDIGAGKGGRVSLMDSPLHMRTLAKMTGEYRGLMLLTYFTTYILGLSEHPGAAPSAGAARTALDALTPPAASVAPLLRVLTQLTKAYVCKLSVPLLFSCMESLGGVGYLNNEEQEYLNVSRLYRDCSVLPIWEGTTDVLSTDFVRALKHPKGGSDCLDAMHGIIRAVAAFRGEPPPAPHPTGWDPMARWESVRHRVTCGSQAELMGEARELLWQVADVLVSVLLFVDASRDGDASARDIWERFVVEKFGAAGRRRGTSAEELQRDRAIVYGSEVAGLSSKL